MKKFSKVKNLIFPLIFTIFLFLGTPFVEGVTKIRFSVPVIMDSSMYFDTTQAVFIYYDEKDSTMKWGLPTVRPILVIGTADSVASFPSITDTTVGIYLVAGDNMEQYSSIVQAESGNLQFISQGGEVQFGIEGYSGSGATIKDGGLLVKGIIYVRTTTDTAFTIGTPTDINRVRIDTSGYATFDSSVYTKILHLEPMAEPGSPEEGMLFVTSTGDSIGAYVGDAWSWLNLGGGGNADTTQAIGWDELQTFESGIAVEDDADFDSLITASYGIDADSVDADHLVINNESVFNDSIHITGGGIRIDSAAWSSNDANLDLSDGYGGDGYALYLDNDVYITNEGSFKFKGTNSLCYIGSMLFHSGYNYIQGVGAIRAVATNNSVAMNLNSSYISFDLNDGNGGTDGKLYIGDYDDSGSYAVFDTLGRLTAPAGGIVITGGDPEDSNTPDGTLLVSSNSDSIWAILNSTEVLLGTSSERSYTWHIGAYDFVSGQTQIGSEGAVHPTNLNGTMVTPFNIPYQINGQTVVLDQIVIYYNTVASGDRFDFKLIRTDHDGTVTTDDETTGIGDGETGNNNTDVLSGDGDLSLSDYAYFITIDQDNCDNNTDTKIYDIKIIGHLE